MVTEIRNFLLSKDISVTDEQIQNEIDKIDKSTLIEAERQRYELELWDKESPINGVSAETILSSRKDIPDGGAIYIIKNDEEIIFLQPHNPRLPGYTHMTDEQALLIGKDAIEKLIEDSVRMKIINTIVATLSDV